MNPAPISELRRIQDAYVRRGLLNRPADASYTPSQLFQDQEVERHFICVLRQSGHAPLARARILDVGCAGGSMLRSLLKYGTSPTNLFGVDIWLDRLSEGHRILPSLNLACADGQALPFADASFDIVIQRTMFSSVLDSSRRSRIGAEMLRVLKPAGAVFSYDVRFTRPGDRDMHAITRAELASLFPDCSIRLARCGLPPPLIRLLAPYSHAICHLASALWPVKTHYWGTVRKLPSKAAVASEPELRT